MADNANSLEYLYYKIRAGNPNSPALKLLFPQLDLDVQKRVQTDTSTINKEADRMHDMTWEPKPAARVRPGNQSSAHRTMMDRSRVDL